MCICHVSLNDLLTYLAALSMLFGELAMLAKQVRDGRVVGSGLATAIREVAGSNHTRPCCAPTPTQRAIPPGSVNEYQRKLRSKRAYHAMH